MDTVPSVTGPRLQGVLVDHAIAWALIVAVAFVGVFLVPDPTALTGILFLSGVLYVPVFFLYKTGMEAIYGRTLGKAARGITVRSSDGSPCTWRGAVVRNVLLVVDFAPTMYLLGWYVARRSETGQRVGDIAADTVVVRQAT
ncbi:Uncharacterized membrane protein YckC, RDD family [Haloarchaeobius iranensis]|uniref:Uncharacterized membrane protein YckC, RDD family n=2 Tax=Haloarchaeobius iranensis TaxID=996166 RepID=A0A1G9VEY2_9EURY|nr:Uncharacterized membrane protein YckC, RDD family [Haloarchaeobius iranensis]